MLVLLMLNGINLSYTQEELSDTFLSIASGKITDRELLIWIIRHESD